MTRRFIIIDTEFGKRALGIAQISEFGPTLGRRNAGTEIIMGNGHTYVVGLSPSQVEDLIYEALEDEPAEPAPAPQPEANPTPEPAPAFKRTSKSRKPKSE